MSTEDHVVPYRFAQVIRASSRVAHRPVPTKPSFEHPHQHRDACIDVADDPHLVRVSSRARGRDLVPSIRTSHRNGSDLELEGGLFLFAAGTWYAQDAETPGRALQPVFSRGFGSRRIRLRAANRSTAF